MPTSDAAPPRVLRTGVPQPRPVSPSWRLYAAAAIWFPTAAWTIFCALDLLSSVHAAGVNAAQQTAVVAIDGASIVAAYVVARALDAVICRG